LCGSILETIYELGGGLARELVGEEALQRSMRKKI